ncbi:hypothetical protein P4J24_22145 [Bacillus anthracis]|uniref:hypothetical protein n=1 Tax=Bacillus cereus group TaxID=86661 RepID=UPI001594BF75|nr:MULTISPECIES: hypothetical protein [Bacillus cereus group]MEB9684582.1 hypothetical protein [Bacillus anthracis]
MTNLPIILGMLFCLGWALFCCLALFVANDENKYLKSLFFSMFMTMLLIKVGGY